jgi:hypothetical protein
MKKREFFSVMGLLVLLLISGPAWAETQCGLSATQCDLSEDTPAILAYLDKAGTAGLDDSAISVVRGQGNTKYVLVKMQGVNGYDGGTGVQWTSDPQGYRYGYWGGAGWSNGQENPTTTAALALGAYADTMDLYFKTHDLVYFYKSGNAERQTADKALLIGLSLLPKTTSSYWGTIYVSTPTGLTTPNVSVYGVSLIGGKYFSGWRPMSYSEYARREAMAALGAKMSIKLVANYIKMQ